MVSFEIFVKSMPPSLSELKVLPSFCFAFNDMTASNTDTGYYLFESWEKVRLKTFDCLALLEMTEIEQKTMVFFFQNCSDPP